MILNKSYKLVLETIDSNFIKSETIYYEFKTIKDYIKKLFGYDISYMKLVISNQPVYNNGTPNTEMNPLQYGGCWIKNKTIQVADYQHLKKVMKYYGVKNISLLNFSRHLIAHELAHEIYKNILSDSEKNNFKEKLKDFRTVYTDIIRSDKLDEEKFCEYIAITILEKVK